MEVIWSRTSEITFEVIVDYIEAKFGKKAALRFILKVKSITTAIKKQPYIYKSFSDNNAVRKATINKQCSLLYEVNNESIWLLYFWDNRQEPID
jgi:plasmid stabilization system protein ParE